MMVVHITLTYSFMQNHAFQLQNVYEDESLMYSFMQNHTFAIIFLMISFDCKTKNGVN